MISIDRYSAPPAVVTEDAGSAGQDNGIDQRTRDDMVGALQELVYRGDIRGISIVDRTGKTLVDFPHLLGSQPGPRLDPIWAAIDAFARVAGKPRIRVDREDGWPVRLKRVRSAMASRVRPT